MCRRVCAIRGSKGCAIHQARFLHDDITKWPQKMGSVELGFAVELRNLPAADGRYHGRREAQRCQGIHQWGCHDPDVRREGGGLDSLRAQLAEFAYCHVKSSFHSFSLDMDYRKNVHPDQSGTLKSKINLGHTRLFFDCRRGN